MAFIIRPLTGKIGPFPQTWRWAPTVRSGQVFAARWAACRPSPFICPVLVATASFLLGPKLSEVIFTHPLLLAKGRGGGHREVPEGRSENALKPSREWGPSSSALPSMPGSPSLLQTGRREDGWSLQKELPKEMPVSRVCPTTKGSKYARQRACGSSLLQTRRSLLWK